MGHMWLKFLNSRKPGLKGQQLVLFKIAMDRLLYGPMFNALQMAFVYKVSGQRWHQVLESLKMTFLQAQVLNFKMWPFAQVRSLPYATQRPVCMLPSARLHLQGVIMITMVCAFVGTRRNLHDAHLKSLFECSTTVMTLTCAPLIEYRPASSSLCWCLNQHGILGFLEENQRGRSLLDCVCALTGLRIPVHQFQLHTPGAATFVHELRRADLDDFSIDDHELRSWMPKAVGLAPFLRSCEWRIKILPH